MTTATPRSAPVPGPPKPAPPPARPAPQASRAASEPITGPISVTGAQSLVHSLEAVGCEAVFGIPGGTILPAYDPLLDSTTVRHILVRHEQGAGPGVDDHQVVRPNEQRPHRHRDPVALVRRGALLPQRLRHHSKHRSAIQPKIPRWQKPNLNLSKMHPLPL